MRTKKNQICATRYGCWWPWQCYRSSLFRHLGPVWLTLHSPDRLELMPNHERYRLTWTETWINGVFPLHCGLATTTKDDEQRTSRKDGTTVSTHISVWNIHLFLSFWIGFKSANTAPGAVEYSLPLARHRNLETLPTFSWTRTDQPRSSMWSRLASLSTMYLQSDFMRLWVSFVVQQSLIYDIRPTCWADKLMSLNSCWRRSSGCLSVVVHLSDLNPLPHPPIRGRASVRSQPPSPPCIRGRAFIRSQLPHPPSALVRTLRS